MYYIQYLDETVEQAIAEHFCPYTSIEHAKKDAIKNTSFNILNADGSEVIDYVVVEWNIYSY